MYINNSGAMKLATIETSKIYLNIEHRAVQEMKER